MVYTSLIVEMLRVRPRLVFWLTALAQAGLWLAVATLAYTAPPGDLAQTLALGREFRLGTVFGPPLAYWLGALAFDVAGGHMIGPYLLAEACVLVTLWSLMRLGGSIVGRQHAALAILLAVGVFAITAPALDFGPWVLLMALWSSALLHLWRVLGEKRRRFWFALAIELGLMLLTSFLAVLLLALVIVFLIATRRGRAALRTLDPWLCVVVVGVIVAPYALWVSQHTELLYPPDGWKALASGYDATTWLQILGGLVLAQAGAAVLIVIAGWRGRQPSPVVTRDGVEPFAPIFIYFFALTAPLAAALAAVVYLPDPPLAAAAPVTVLTALAVILLAGDTIILPRQRPLARVWTGMLLAPPLVFALVPAIVPRLLPIELRVAQPASAIGSFFAETFTRRTGKPLTIIAGDHRLAALVAVSAPSRPRLYLDAAHTPWLGDDDIRTNGAVVLWRARDVTGAPPPEITARFPTLAAELPHVFERRLPGLGGPLRIGWAVIRPRQVDTER